MKLRYILNLIFLILLAPALAGCTKGMSAPEVKNAFKVNAVCTRGDFSYSCSVEKTDSSVVLCVTSTSAEGMTITCDGQTVSFNFEDMEKSFEKESVDVTNPALILYEVLFSGGEGSKNEAGLFEYTGTVSAGRYVMSINPDGTLNTVSLTDADTVFVFDLQ